MKKNVMLGALMMVSTIIFAQHPRPQGDPKAMADKRAERMKTELGLNDDQYSRVKAITEKFAENNVKLRKDTALTVGTARNRMKELRTEQQAQFKSILTADQWTKYTNMKAKRAEGWKKHRRGKMEKG